MYREDYPALYYPALPCLYYTLLGTPWYTTRPAHYRVHCSTVFDVSGEHALGSEVSGSLGSPVLRVIPDQSCPASSEESVWEESGVGRKNVERLDRIG